MRQSGLQRSFQIVIKDSSHAFTVLIRLLSTLISPISHEFGTTWTDSAIIFDYAWVLGCLRRLWNAITLEVESSFSSRFPLGTLVTFLDMVRNISTCTRKVKDDTITSIGIIVLLSQVVSSLLALNSTQSSIILEKSICLSIFELAVSCRSSRAMLQNFNEHALQTLLESKKNEIHFDGFGSDLQVRMSPLYDWIGNPTYIRYSRLSCWQFTL